MSKENNLPERINAFRSAEAKAHLQGVLLIKDMLRLRDSLLDDSGSVGVEMEFGIDEQGIRFVSGHAETQVKLQCQRCMEPYIYGIITDFVSGLVKTEEEAKDLPERFDPVVTEDGTFQIQERVEDELIISLPIVPMHDPKECKVKTPNVLLDSDQVSEGERENPFKVIEILRTKQK